jgi:hypothetical protein
VPEINAIGPMSGAEWRKLAASEGIAATVVELIQMTDAKHLEVQRRQT